MKYIDNDNIIVFNIYLYFSLGVIYYDGDDNFVFMYCLCEFNYIMVLLLVIINLKIKEYSFKFFDCFIV